MIYRPRHFGLQEIVSSEIFEARGERAWELLDVYALVTLDQLREHFGPISINDWHWGGKFQYSGMRPFVGGVGAVWSMHRFGRAFDCKPKETTPQEMHAMILAKPEKFPHIRVLEAIEATPTWVHWDTRNHTRSEIWVVNP